MIHLKLTLMALLWASGLVASKTLIAEAGPFTIAFSRLLIALLILALFVHKFEKNLKFEWRTFGACLGAAFLGLFCYNFLFLEGLRFVDVSRGAIIISVVPVVIALGSFLFLQEKMNFLRILGVAFSVVGAGVVITNGRILDILSSVGRGEFYFIISVFCLAAYTIVSKRLLATHKIFVLKGYVVTAGTLLFLGPAVWEWAQSPHQVYSVSFMVNILYLGVGPTVIAALIYYEALDKVGAARASQYMNLIPVFSVIFAVLFLGESITGSLLVGGGLVTTGLYLTNT